MTQTVKAPVSRESPAAHRFGYGVAIVINIVMLIIVNNILGWELLPFLTQDFAGLLWLIDLSLAATVVANLAFMYYDEPWFKSVVQIGLNVISFIVTLKIFQVFPFDFTVYRADWSGLARLVLILGMVGVAIATVVEVVRSAHRASMRLGVDSH